MAPIALRIMTLTLRELGFKRDMGAIGYSSSQVFTAIYADGGTNGIYPATRSDASDLQLCLRVAGCQGRYRLYEILYQHLVLHVVVSATPLIPWSHTLEHYSIISNI
eukprot:6200663-Pleurochrysis_carterae.AAC.2